eukprot:3976547-Amphidinium_carterae.1
MFGEPAQEETTAQKHVRDRRWIFFQYGLRCPDDLPWPGLEFNPARTKPAGLLPPVKITTRDLGVDTQWSCWRNPVQQKRIRTFEQSMHRVRGLGLPAHVKARIVKSLHSTGLYGAEVGGIPKTGMTKIRTGARKALGKGAGLRRSAPLESIAHGGPAADPQVSADLSTVRVWHRRILVGKLEWPQPDNMWDNALRPGRGRGPTRNLKQLAERLGWSPALGGWTCNAQWSSWDEATLRAKPRCCVPR